MAEFIKHALGICGEHFHPNLWTLLIGGVGISSMFLYIRLYIKCKFKQAFTHIRKLI
jgi:hypothetical protein